MNKYVITILFLILAGIGVWIWLQDNDDTGLEQVLGKETASTTEKTGLSSTTPVNKPSKNISADEAWKVIQNYLAYAKAKDMSGVASLSYQLSDSCSKALKNSGDNSSKTDCLGKIENAYSMGSAFKQSDFTNVWSDSRQIILSTPWKNWDGSNIGGLLRSIIYEVNTSSGLKVLYFNNAAGVFLPMGASTTRAQMDAELERRTVDTDQDGIPDYDEKCTNQDSTCVKTDPNKLDTNGNGFWDGVERLFYKK